MRGIVYFLWSCSSYLLQWCQEISKRVNVSLGFNFIARQDQLDLETFIVLSWDPFFRDTKNQIWWVWNYKIPVVAYVLYS